MFLSDVLLVTNRTLLFSGEGTCHRRGHDRAPGIFAFLFALSHVDLPVVPAAAVVDSAEAGRVFAAARFAYAGELSRSLKEGNPENEGGGREARFCFASQNDFRIPSAVRCQASIFSPALVEVAHGSVTDDGRQRFICHVQLNLTTTNENRERKT